MSRRVASLSTSDLDLLAAMVAEGGYVLAGYRIGRSRQGVANRLTLLRARYRCDTTLQLVWLHRDAIEAHTAPRSLWTAS